MQRARGAGVGHTRPSIWKKEEKKEVERRRGCFFFFFFFFILFYFFLSSSAIPILVVGGFLFFIIGHLLILMGISKRVTSAISPYLLEVPLTVVKKGTLPIKQLPR